MSITDKALEKSEETIKNELQDAVEKSRIIIFVLTNSYYKSTEFQELFEASKNEKKIIIFLLAEDINLTLDKNIDFNQLNVIKFFKNDSLLKGESFYRLCYLIYSTIGRQDLVTFHKDKVHIEAFKNQQLADFNENLPRYRKNIYGICIKKSLNEKTREIGCLFDFQEKNEVLITIGDRLLIYDPNTFKFIRQIRFYNVPENEINDICYQQETNKLCLLGDTCIYFLNTEDYTLDSISHFNYNENFDTSCLQLFAYNNSNNKIYFYNMQTQEIVLSDRLFMIKKAEVKGAKEMVKSMKFINDFLYVLKSDCILVFNSHLDFVTSFGNSILFKANCFMVDKNTNTSLLMEI